MEEEKKLIRLVKTLLSEHGEYSFHKWYSFMERRINQGHGSCWGVDQCNSEIPTVADHNYSVYHTGFWKNFELILVSVRDRRLKIVYKGFQLPDYIAFSEDLSIPGGVAHRHFRMLSFEFADYI